MDALSRRSLLIVASLQAAIAAAALLSLADRRARGRRPSASSPLGRYVAVAFFAATLGSRGQGPVRAPRRLGLGPRAAAPWPPRRRRGAPRRRAPCPGRSPPPSPVPSACRSLALRPGSAPWSAAGSAARASRDGGHAMSEAGTRHVHQREDHRGDRHQDGFHHPCLRLQHTHFGHGRLDLDRDGHPHPGRLPADQAASARSPRSPSSSRGLHRLHQRLRDRRTPATTARISRPSSALSSSS